MEARELILGIRRLYAAGAALALGAAFMTCVITSTTADYFAWPIAPDISAAFLGGCYVAATVLLFLSSRARTWAQARLAAPPVMVISLLLLAATLIHWDRFDHDHLVFWLWLAAYVLVPPALLVLLARQLREPGFDPPARRRLPAWARVGLGVQAGAMLGAGAVLFAAPGTGADVWPWELTPLTSRAIGAFTFGFGIAAVAGVAENDIDRLRPAALSFVALAAAELIAVARYSDQFDLGLAGWLYLGFHASALAGGLAIVVSRSASSSSAEPPDATSQPQKQRGRQPG